MGNPLGQRLRELPGPLLLTGHTGFKGTWMTFLLEHLNVPVVGYSLPPEKESLFDRANRLGVIPEALADIRDYEELESFINLHKPSTIIHMAAQPLVLKSYESPRETFDINVMGTVNVLDIAFKKKFVKTVIVVTTDKVYRNDDSGRPFVETDPLEGKDPYSASKVGSEAVVAAWQQIARVSGGPNVVSVRAGNVIGGGDFAENRIIPDLIRGAISGNAVEIRNPQSSRPWQHVLDPLIGYLMTISKNNETLENQSINFGPQGSSLSVEEVVEIGKRIFPELQVRFSGKEIKSYREEAIRLSLDSSLAYEKLSWKTRYDQETAITSTFNWWARYLSGESQPEELCHFEIKNFISQ